jgi:hypothetical protein
MKEATTFVGVVLAVAILTFDSLGVVRHDGVILQESALAKGP